MSKIPESVSRQFFTGLDLVSRGKVRDTYRINDELLLPVATDRVSIFDFVLPAEVPQKGEVLAAMNAFWTMTLLKKYSHDTLAFGQGIDRFLPDKLKGNPNIQKRAAVVRKLDMIPVEAIIRGCLTGSGWNAYRDTSPDHIVCGHRLIEGFKDGDELPEPIFTPTTKAAEGHDEHMDVDEVRERFGSEMERISICLFREAASFARTRGIVIADTKLEFGTHAASGNLTLGDERFTPDSSRFWRRDDWQQSQKEGRSPTSFDKQFVREWGKLVGIDKLNPLNAEDITTVHQLVVPQDIILKTRQIYRYIFYLLTGMRLEVFQRHWMGIKIWVPRPLVEIVLGSESDVPQIESGLKTLELYGASYRVHVISCHRNPEDLRQYAESISADGRVVIAAAGKAAALPGVLQSWLRYFGKEIPVIGVALKGTTAESDMAAKLSIEELPGNPVFLSQKQDAYFGPEGFAEACKLAMTSEFFIPEVKQRKPVFNLKRS